MERKTDLEYWQDQVVLITGGSRGLGRSLAQHFSSLGCRVAINYIKNEVEAAKTLEMCDPERTRIYQGNVAIKSDVQNFTAQIEKDFGPISILVNNAGHTADQLLMSMSDDEWHSIINVHLTGAFYCLREVLPMMLSRRHGRIINVSSVSAVKGQMGQTNYSAAKAGLIGLTKSLAREVGKKNITCNAMILGAFKTEMTDVLSEEVIQEMKKATAVKRLGKVEEAAQACIYLASQQASYTTGQCLTVDGGMT